MTPLPALCGVCKSHANSPHGFGFRGRPYLHACQEPICFTLLPKVYHMSKDVLDAYEQKAISEGGKAAMAYLQSINCPDMRNIESDQWHTFCKTLEYTRQAALRRMIENDEAPF